MKNALIIISLLCIIKLDAQQRLISPLNDLYLKQDYQSAQRQYDLGLTQGGIAKKWGIATMSLSGISLLGFALRGDENDSNIFSYWVPVASMGTAAVGLIIKISSLSNVGTGRYKMDLLYTGKTSEIATIQIGTTNNGIGLMYNF